MIKKIIILIILLSSTLSAQFRGTPRNLRVKVDANGYLLATAAAQTNPVTSVTFNQARLSVDSNGYLQVIVSGGTSSLTTSIANTFCLDVTNKDIYVARQAANSFGFYTGAVNCATGALRFLINATGFGFGAGVPTTNIPIFKSFSVNGQLQEQLVNTNAGTSNYAEYLIKAGDTSTYFGSEPSNSSDTFGVGRGYLITQSTGAGSGVSGLDIFSCASASPAACFLRIMTNGSNAAAVRLMINTNINLQNNASLLWTTDNNADIGASGATRPRTGYFGTSVISPLVTSEHVASGAVTAVANVGANSCGTTAATIAGTDNAGAITVGATAGTQCRIQFTIAAPTRRHCTVTDETTGNLMRSTYIDTTHTDVLGTMVAGDVITYTCFAR